MAKRWVIVPEPRIGIPVTVKIDFENNQVIELVSQAEAARQLDVSRATVHFLVSSGRLRSADIAGRRFVLVEDVLAYKPIRPGPKKGSAKPKKKMASKAGAKKANKKRGMKK